MFAIQDGGWCAADNTAAQTFDKYNESAMCNSDGKGGPYANQVYVIKGKDTQTKLTKGHVPMFFLTRAHFLDKRLLDCFYK